MPAAAAFAALWLAGAVLLTATGALASLPPPLPQLLGALATAGLFVAAASAGEFKTWLRAIDLRIVVALHLTRFVGGYFLWLYGRNRLPYAFAVPAGVGDLAVAAGATLLLALGDPRRRPRVLMAWNGFGLLDILLVVVAAARQGIADRASLHELLEMPLGLLPTFLVPLLIASHALVFWRLLGKRAWHLAQVNVARMRAPLEDPLMAGFVAELDRINRLADESAGFVWRLQTGEGNATAIRAYEDDTILFNLSVWESIDALHRYVYRSDHVALLRARKQWFGPFSGASLALWWVPAGHRPSIDEAKERLRQLEEHGPSPRAFTFKAPFPVPDARVERAGASLETCEWAS